MEFPQVQEVLKDITADAEHAQRVLRTLLPNLSLWCTCDADALRLLGSIVPAKIAQMSGLDMDGCQRLKDASTKQLELMKSERVNPDSVEVLPSDPEKRLLHLLAKEGFEVQESRFLCDTQSFSPA
jgi:hypothetical protein